MYLFLIYILIDLVSFLIPNKGDQGTCFLQKTPKKKWYCAQAIQKGRGYINPHSNIILYKMYNTMQNRCFSSVVDGHWVLFHCVIRPRNAFLFDVQDPETIEHSASHVPGQIMTRKIGDVHSDALSDALSDAFCFFTLRQVVFGH